MTTPDNNQSDSPNTTEVSRPEAAKPAPAGKSVKHWILFILIFALGLAADLWSKHAVFDYLIKNVQPDELTGKISKTIIPHVLDFTLSTNPGVVFGFDHIPDWAVIAASFFAFGLISIFFAFSPKSARWTHCALAMILAGAAGNLYDRLFSYVEISYWGQKIISEGEVRDFIDCSNLYFPYIYNIADVFLVVGVGILMVISIFAEKKTLSADQNTSETQETNAS